MMDKRYREILDKLDRILALLEGKAGMADPSEASGGTTAKPKHDGVNVSEKPAEAPHGFGGRRENPKPAASKAKDK